jgi:hypothetical protein
MGADQRSLPQGVAPRLLSVEQAAAYCGVSRTLFDREVSIHIPAVWLGQRRLYDRLALDQLINWWSGIGNLHLNRSPLFLANKARGDDPYMKRQQQLRECRRA